MIRTESILNAGDWVQSVQQRLGCIFEEIFSSKGPGCHNRVIDFGSMATKTNLKVGMWYLYINKYLQIMFT